MDELVDVINERGDVVGSVMKSVAHQEGSLHKTVLACVRNSQGEQVLVRQSSDRQDAGQFVFPVGGHIKSGESEIEALGREALEELGLTDVSNIRPIGEAVYNREVLGRKENHLFVMFEIISDEPPVLGDEAVEYRWFKDSEYFELIATQPELFGASHHFAVQAFFPDHLNR